MFVVPLPVSVNPVQRRERQVPLRPQRRGAQRGVDSSLILLLVWLLIGSFVLLLLPSARYDQALGATLPFWLVAAPLLDLVWLSRARAWAVLRAWSSKPRARRLGAVRCAPTVGSARRATGLVLSAGS